MTDSSRLRAARAIVATGFVASLLISHRLWDGVGRSYPRAPLVAALDGVAQRWGAWWEPLLSALLCAALVGVALARTNRGSARAAALALTALALLALGDQLRWQPWAYQYAIMLAALAALARPATAPPPDDGERDSAPVQHVLNAWRVTIALTYGWSGAQKLAGGGSSLLLPLARLLAGELGVGPTRVLLVSNALTGLIEIAIGLGLLTARFRRPALIGAVVTHALILLSLATLAANANLVIWPWNVALAAAAVVLFGRTPAALDWRAVLAPRQGAAHAAALVLVGLLPALSLVGRWDPYLSAALYSGNLGAAYLQWAPDGSADPVPPAHVVADPRNGGRHLAGLAGWAIAELQVPGYPADRVHRQVARQLCRRAHPTQHFTLIVRRRLTIAEVARGYLAHLRGTAPPAPQRIYTCEMLLRVRTSSP